MMFHEGHYSPTYHEGYNDNMDNEFIEAESDLNAELSAACDNPNDFDFGFEAQRENEGFANFDYDAEEAERLRDEEYERMEQEQEADDTILLSYDERWDDGEWY